MNSEKINIEKDHPRDAKCEDILFNSIEEIALYVNIYNDLPTDAIDLDSEEPYEYHQGNSLIVISDETSENGRWVSEYMIEEDELESSRNSEQPSDIAVGLLTYDDIKNINDYRRLKIQVPPKIDGKVNVLVISDEYLIETISCGPQ